MFKKVTHLSLCLIMCMLFAVVTSSCSKDDDKDEPKASETAPSQTSPIVGTWVKHTETDTYFDNYTLVFQSNGTGYIRNDYGTKATLSEQMNFDWSLTTTAYGYYLLSVIYKSGDINIDGPFSGGYAQYNSTVTIAGTTLSISTGDNTVMLFTRAK